MSGPLYKQYENLVEIGGGDSWTSQALSWSTHAERVTIYEPHPLLWADLNRAAAGLGNVRVEQAAVSSHYAKLVCMGYASYLQGAPSFLATSVEPEGEKLWEPLAREVPLVKVDRMDYGTIDGLLLTCNGAEMDILPRLVSRPKTIWTKHYIHNGAQATHANAVWGWLDRARYTGRVLERNQHGTFFSVEWGRNG